MSEGGPRLTTMRGDMILEAPIIFDDATVGEQSPPRDLMAEAWRRT